MKACVTGAAGFIGSTLCERLLADGWDVIGVDRFTEAYSVSLKWHNVARSLASGLDLVEEDLAAAELDEPLANVDVVFHLAAMPGVRDSWANGFDDYNHNNITATQKLLEAVSRSSSRPRVVYGSSSSVYGNAESYPVEEDVQLRPHSPYGLTKLSAEYLVGTYARNFGLEVVSLRFFSVFGPRQRPDMGVHRLIEAALNGETFTVFGDGTQVRDMTFVDDVVDGLVLAGSVPEAAGMTANIAGGCTASLNGIIEIVMDEVGPIDLRYGDEQLGDVRRTGGKVDRAQTLGFAPKVGLEDGIRRQIEWHQSNRDVLSGVS